MKLTDKLTARYSGNVNRLYSESFPGRPNLVVFHPWPVQPGKRPKDDLVIGLALLANPHLTTRTALILGARCWHLMETGTGWELGLVTIQDRKKLELPPVHDKHDNSRKGVPIPWMDTYNSLKVAEGLMELAVSARLGAPNPYEVKAA